MKSTLSSCIGLLLFVHVLALPTVKDNIDDDSTLDVPDLIKKYGYPAEVHHVTTPDGYILTLHRIPHGKSSSKISSRVAFIQHGLLCSSADWVLTGVKKGLGYLLADQGYDVWMGNFRGNHHSRNHTTLNPDKNPEFWHFSWHEMGYYDLPTMIDYVLSATNQTSLYHVGHSQGTTTLYVMGATRPEYNKKIRAHISLAPVAFMDHLTSPLLRLIAFWQGPVATLVELIGLNEFLPNNAFMETIGKTMCADKDPTQALCSDVLFILCGFSPKEMNATVLPVMLGHTPAGSSTRQLLHYGQNINSGHFRQYDFGTDKNRKLYNGSKTAPDYNLKAVTAPVYLVYSHNDWLASEIDVIRLYNQLPNAKGKFLVADNGFNHLDYLYAIHAPEYVYDMVISLLARL